MKRAIGQMVLQLHSKCPTATGGEISCVNDNQELIGVIPVFKTKKAARAIFGPNVPLRGLEFLEDVKHPGGAT